ncbi:MAG: NAD(P)-dependent oxidoreductase [Pararhodobacter sp.]
MPVGLRKAELLIVGANSRIGRLLQPVLAGAPVVASSRTGRVRGGALPAFAWSPLDGPEALLRQVDAGGAPRAMLVLAGTTPSTGTDMTLNVALARACTAAAREAGIRRVLLASSSAVYGAGRAVPWSEDDACAPRGGYGQAKLEAERATAGPGVCALRIGNVAGADALLTNPARPLILDRFDDGGTPMRSYIGPASLARVFRALAVAPALPPVLNIGAPTPVSMDALARAADLPVTLREAPPTAIQHLVLDCTRLESLVPFDHSESTPEALVAQWRACKED